MANKTPLPKQRCLYCQKPFSGNDNKKFCSDGCKNNYHNKRRKLENKEISGIINALKTNRRIIMDLLGDKSIKSVSEQRLLDQGFIFRYHTHRRINKGDGKEYIFCFDYGYLPNGKGWYKLLKAFREED